MTNDQRILHIRGIVLPFLKTKIRFSTDWKGAMSQLSSLRQMVGAIVFPKCFWRTLSYVHV